MVQGKWFPQGSDITIPLDLRRAIFQRGRDALDGEAQQVVVCDGEIPVGIARLWWKEGAFYLGELGVLPGARKRGFGDLLVRLVLYKVLVHHGRQVRLAAPPEMVPFFTRYGFTPDEKEAAQKDVISMSLWAQNIRLDACQGGCQGCPTGSVSK
ncbi:MAG: GNAT family N-acetyltransferase [Clostridiales bacterium]|nr:GNAT family N-acetyltransferase [Clostridiales bacterium]